MLGSSSSPRQVPDPEGLPGLSLYCDTVFGPPMTRDEEVALKLHLEHILRQVQYSVKAMGLQPVELCDIDIVRPFPSRRGAITGAYPSLFKRSGSEVSRLPRRSLEAELEDTKMKNQELVAVFEQLSSQMKIKVATAMNNKHVTPEFAQDLDQLVECFNKNVQKAMQAGGGLLSMRGLLRMMNMYDKINTLRDNADTFGSLALCVVTIIDHAVQSVGSSPIQFHSIGKEAKSILNNDFTFAKLRLNCDPYRNVSLGVGGEVGGEENIKEILVKCRYGNNSISFSLLSLLKNVAVDPTRANAPENQARYIASTRISLDKLWGSNMKSVLEVPFPSLNAKFEVRGGRPYAVCAGGLKLIPNQEHRIPVFFCSGVFGVKYCSFGYQFLLREWQRYSTFGVSVNTDLLAVGLTYKSPGIYNATFWKKIVDSSTTIAGQASYLPPPGENNFPPDAGVGPGFKFSVGLKHSIDPTLYWKTRVSTDGASFLVKKSDASGMFSVKGAMHVDFSDPWRIKKLGVVCSFRL